jgi:hypothetical protein
LQFLLLKRLSKTRCHWKQTVFLEIFLFAD